MGLDFASQVCVGGLGVCTLGVGAEPSFGFKYSCFAENTVIWMKWSSNALPPGCSFSFFVISAADAVPSHHSARKADAAAPAQRTAAASLQAKGASGVTATFPVFLFLLQLAHDAMAWDGFQSALFRCGILLPSKQKSTRARDTVNCSSTSLLSSTGAKGLRAAAGCWAAAARPGGTTRKRRGRV